ncbi:transcriptional repressor [[Clostridium] polysaccharolyticum]|uniref:Fur family transcriptional regulator, ferric uptake regulator n=1 Tax=[Clostridium] polysaccharolyticum TaxID=29364 RepID=A0A1I0BLQ4_9FIRM|nr:transcriptional repressor [[Clostridium] polysaccharolyticum]SET07887.1 Fur family transcriptional regulator, ferric uptake regulator [[Clostridium] polysaccharolyticum]
MSANEKGDSETLMKKQFIIEELKKRKCRMTSQRSLIIDIILQNQCSCCKEIYYQAVEKDSSIGIATVYRMLALLEEAGVIDRKNMYAIQGKVQQEQEVLPNAEEKVVFIGESNQVELLETNWYNEVKEHLKKRGMIKNQDISIVIRVKNSCKEGMDCCD